MPKLTLELNTKNAEQLPLFFQIISNPAQRHSLAGQKLPAEAQELIALADDKSFLALSKKTVKAYARYLDKKATHNDVTVEGKQLLTYVEQHYPNALVALKRFGKNAKKKLPKPDPLRPPTFAVNFDVMANVEVVVNAGVYTNVAVATYVAIAVGAVAVAAAFVV